MNIRRPKSLYFLVKCSLVFVAAFSALNSLGQELKSAEPDPKENATVEKPSGEVQKTTDEPKGKPPEKKEKTCNTEKNQYCDAINKITKKIVIAEKPDERRWGGTLSYYLYADRGRLYFQAKDYSRALTDYNRALDSKYYRNLDVIAERGEIYLIMGKYDDALKDFDSIPARNNNWRVHVGRGKIYLSRREFDRAFEDFDRAIYLNRRLPDAYFGRGVIYLRRGEEFREQGDDYLARQAFRNAFDDLDSVVEINLLKTSAETYRMLAKVSDALGNKSEAEKYRQKAEEAIDEKPADVDSEEEN